MSMCHWRHRNGTCHSVTIMTGRQGLPRLWGAEEIRERLGYSRQWTYTLLTRRDFPLPVYTLAMGDIWLADDVETWIREHRPELAAEPEAD